MADDFDPRLAALAHAGAAEGIAPTVGRGVDEHNATLERIVAQSASAIACGLVYVGDQIAKLAAPAAGSDQEMWREAFPRRGETQ